MPKDIEYDPTEQGTLRPNEASIPKAGKQFQPMDVDERPTHIILPNGVSPLDPYTLFELYYNDVMIASMVECTNKYDREVGEGKHARGKDWYDTTPSEIYLYLATRVYMTLHEENEIDDYWKKGDLKPNHPCSEWLSRNRYNELHIRYELGEDDSTPYTRLEPLNSHIQEVTKEIWVPGPSVAADEIIVPYDGRSFEIVNIPNKPNLIGAKVWGVGQSNCLLVWNFHTPGQGKGPVNTQVPEELGGKKTGKSGNKTQAVVSKMINQLAQPGESDYLPALRGPAPYYLWLDNLFTSTRFLEYMRKIWNIGISGTTRANAGILQPVLDFQKKDKGKLPWGCKISLPTQSGLVCHVAWKDQGKAPSLMMSTVKDGEKDVESLRKRPKQRTKHEEEKHKPFKGKSTAVLPIPDIFDCYNYQMGPIDGFDHLCAMNSGLRRVKRGIWQALEHWLLRVVLVNTYVIAQVWLREEEVSNLRSQVKWREGIIRGLLLAFKRTAQNTPLHLKGTISHRKPGPLNGKRCINAEPVKMEKPKECHWCKAIRQEDRPMRRKALGELSANQRPAKVRHESSYKCKACNTPLCTGKRGCMKLWHEKLAGR